MAAEVWDNCRGGSAYPPAGAGIANTVFAYSPVSRYADPPQHPQTLKSRDSLKKLNKKDDNVL